MKVRNGFVSNSSSSSFIVKEKMTTAELAKKMVNLIYESREGRGNNSSRKWTAPALEWLEKNINSDEPIIIPWSCNYDTFIFRMGSNENNNIAVDTCNNEDWYSMEDIDIKWCGEDLDLMDEWEGNTEDVEFMDLTVMQKVKRSEYKDLYERYNDLK